jgi:hypothetical protein
MPPPAESPFKRDEPVSRSAKWMWLAVLPAVAWTLWNAWGTILRFDLDMATFWRLLETGLSGTLTAFLIRAARAAWRCRQHRNFDVMGAAVRLQRPFWALLSVATALGSLTLTVGSIRKVDHNRALQRFISENPETLKPRSRETTP